MRELDKLTLILLAEHDPMRAVCVGVVPGHPSTLLHAKCVEKWMGKDRHYHERYGIKYEKFTNLPERTDIATWGNGCAECGRIVPDITYLKPI